MSKQFALTLLDGSASMLETESNKKLSLGGAEHKSYDHAQQAVELALRAVGGATGRMVGDVPDEDAIKSALSTGAFSLVLRGNIRECRVAVLHLHARLGLDYDAMLDGKRRAGLIVEPIVDAPDRYATYSFESDMRPLDAMRQLVERWIVEARRVPRAKDLADKSATRWRQMLAVGVGAGAPVRVVITGVTGAGKSTFLNAVLGREVVPYSSGICTAAILHIKKVSTAAREGFKVVWRSPSDITRQIKDLLEELKHAESNRTRVGTALRAKVGEVRSSADALQERRRSLSRKIAALKQALQLSSGREALRPLCEIGPFARNSPDSMAEGVDHIIMQIDHPLLSHIEIIDAPGLRDGDEQRQRLLIKAFEGDAAWLYLAPASERSNTCTADWQHIQRLAHNEAGVLVLTKADGQPPDPGKTPSETMSARMRDYQAFGWKRPLDWCSALLPAKLAALGPNGSEDELDMAFQDAKLQGILNLSRTAGRRLSDFMVNRRREPELWGAFVDYALDASRLPVALRRVGVAIYEDAIARRLAQGQAELLAAVKEAIQQVHDAYSQAEKVRQAHDVIGEHERRRAELKDKLLSIAEVLADMCAEHAKTVKAIETDSEVIRTKFDETIEKLESTMESRFDEVFAEQSRPIWMSGARSFSVVTEFEAPLSESAHALLKEHAHRVMKAVRADHTTGILSNYVILDVKSVGNVHDEEDFWEWASTTQARMKKATKEKIGRCAAGLRKGFASKVLEIGAFAQDALSRKQIKVAEEIKALKGDVAELTRAIKENDPGQSRAVAENALRTLSSHGEFFKTFLREVERSAKLRR